MALAGSMVSVAADDSANSPRRARLAWSSEARQQKPCAQNRHLSRSASCVALGAGGEGNKYTVALGTLSRAPRLSPKLDPFWVEHSRFRELDPLISLCCSLIKHAFVKGKAKRP